MNFLFEMYKDKDIGNSETFRKEILSKFNNVNITEAEIRELYIKVINYQVKKYGRTLYGYFIDRKDMKRIHLNARIRKHHYKKQRGII